MANNNNTGNKENKGNYNPDAYSSAELVKGLLKNPVSLNLRTLGFKEKASSLAIKFEQMFIDSFHINEIDHIFVKPKLNRDGTLATVLCRAYFDTKDVVSGNIVRKSFIGEGNGNNAQTVRTIIPLVGGGVVGGGDFTLSDNFKECLAPLSINDDGRIDIRTIPRNKWIATMDLDFFALMSVALGIKSNDPYNFTIVEAKSISNGSDYSINIMKYIDTRFAAKRGRKGNRVDYDSLDREWAQQNDAYEKTSRRNF